MKPYYEQDGITIYHGDCREVLPTLQGGSIDLVLTDPPFGIGWSRATWQDAESDYPALMTWLVAESNRVVRDGFIFVFQAMPNVARFHEWFPAGWRLFAACKNFAQIRPVAIWHSWDPVVFWANGTPWRSAPGTSPNRDYHVGNVAGVFGERTEHPCPRPLDTTRHIVNIGCAPDGLILDPFMGSGTTLVAALQLGRRAVGIEIEERYCEMAAKRLAQGVLPIYEPVASPRAEQEVMALV